MSTGRSSAATTCTVLASSADPPEFAVLRKVLGPDDAIEAAASAGDAERSKPAPDLVLAAPGPAGTSPRQARFVATRSGIVRACQRGGVPRIGLCSGEISSGELLDAGAAAVFAGPAELVAATAGRLADVRWPPLACR
jgi:phosphoglycolate phosphatase-like HAD superfamily hydrolase